MVKNSTLILYKRNKSLEHFIFLRGNYGIKIQLKILWTENIQNIMDFHLKLTRYHYNSNSQKRKDLWILFIKVKIISSLFKINGDYQGA